jgi:hypothetical protein
MPEPSRRDRSRRLHCYISGAVLSVIIPAAADGFVGKKEKDDVKTAI